MSIKRIVFVIGCILVFTGILLIAADFPIRLVNPLLIVAGLILAPLSIFEDNSLLFGTVCNSLGMLIISIAAAIFLILGAALFLPYELIALGLALIASGTVLFVKQH